MNTFSREELASKKDVKELRETVQELIQSFSFTRETVDQLRMDFEHARRICIKLFTEGKIERTKIVEKVGRPFFKYWKK